MDRYEVHSRWAVAVEQYRRSVDLYRQVLEMRANSRRVGGDRTGALVIARPLRVEEPQPVAVEPAPGRMMGALTIREREVAYLIARGFTNAQIADDLVVTRGTVANHVAHILSKLSLSNRTQLAAYVTRHQNGEALQPIAG